MKKIVIVFMILICLTGCEKSSNKLGGDKPLNKNYSDVVFTISKKNNACIPVKLIVYKDGNYELFTAYEACNPGKACDMMLKYTKSIKGQYDYEIMKIIENSINYDDKSYTNENLIEYEIYMGNTYVEQGFGYVYTVEKGKINRYLEDFSKKINVDLNLCAEPEYID